MYSVQIAGESVKYTAIIFDMDGTIVDTDQVWNQATRLLIESKGIAFTQEIKDILHPQIHGLAVPRSCKIIKELFALPDQVEDLMAEKVQFAQSMYQNGITFIDGFVDFHRTLTAKNLRSAVATNADDLSLALTDKILNLRQFFGEHLYNISCVGGVCKPSPDVFLHAAQKLGVAPEMCIVIEDSTHGVNAARKAGMFCIGINTSQDRTKLQNAHHIVECYADIDLQTLLKK